MKKGFLSLEVRWKVLRKVGLVVLGVMLVLYTAGFCLNDGPSMNYLGWVYWTKWGELPEVGQVFRFVPADKPAWMKYLPHCTWVKRCVGITPEGLYVFEGDNTEWSMDSQPVPADHIAGTIWAAYSPERVARSWSFWGSFINHVTLNLQPHDYHLVDENTIEIRDHDLKRVVIYRGGWFVGTKEVQQPGPNKSYKVRVGRGDTLILTRVDILAGNEAFRPGSVDLRGDVREYYKPGTEFVVLTDPWPDRLWKKMAIVRVTRTELVDPYYVPPDGATRVYYEGNCPAIPDCLIGIPAATKSLRI